MTRPRLGFGIGFNLRLGKSFDHKIHLHDVYFLQSFLRKGKRNQSPTARIKTCRRLPVENSQRHSRFIGKRLNRHRIERRPAGISWGTASFGIDMKLPPRTGDSSTGKGLNSRPAQIIAKSPFADTVGFHRIRDSRQTPSRPEDRDAQTPDPHPERASPHANEITRLPLASIAELRTGWEGDIPIFRYFPGIRK